MAGAVVALMLLTGCQGGGNPSAGPASDEATASAPASAVPTTADVSPSEPATPEPSPASSLGPAANLPVPVKPALADENSKEGLEAFTKYWFELLSYSYLTNEWDKLEEETDPGCRTCESIRSAVTVLYGQDRWLRGGEVTVTSFDSDFELTTNGSVTAYVGNQQSSIEYFEKDGTIMRTVPKQDPPAFDVVNALYEDGQWLLLDYGAPEGTS